MASNGRVLVAAGEQIRAHYWSAFFGEAGILCTEAYTASQAEFAMQRQVPWVVLLELDRQLRLTANLAERLRSINRLVRIVVVTPQRTMDHLIDCVDRGVCDVFREGDPAAWVLEAVDRALAQCRRWVVSSSERGPASAQAMVATDAGSAD